MELLHEKETERLIGFLFEVRNSMGAGWSEEIYHQALLHTLRVNDIDVQHKPRRQLEHRGVGIYTFEPDLIINDKIILELKVNSEFKGKQFPAINEAQLLQYLKIFGKDLGLLVNFAHSKVGLKRMVFHDKSVEIHEDYEHLKAQVNANNKPLLRLVRQAMFSIVQTYGIGFPQTVYRDLIATECKFIGLDCNRDVEVPVVWNEVSFGSQPISHLLIDNQILVLVTSNVSAPATFDFLKTRSYLKALHLDIGLVINFGRHNVQMVGTSTI